MSVPQATILSRAAHFASSTFSSASTSLSHLAGRAVSSTSSFGQTLAAYAKAIYAVAAKFFSSVSTSATTFAYSQPYVAGAALVGTTAAVAFLAVRHFRNKAA